MKKKQVEKDRGKVELEATVEEQKGRYCNVAVIHHTSTEFVLDFVFRLGNQGRMVSRVITNPQHAKSIMTALAENISKYEAKFGEIRPAEQAVQVSETAH